MRALSRETAADGRTVFLSSHSLDEVQHVADRVGIIRSGRLVDVDRVETLRERATAARDGHLRAASRSRGAGGGRTGPGRLATRSPTSSRSRPTSRRSSSSSTGRPATAAELLRRGIRDHRRALVGWVVGIAAYCVVIASIFPSIEGTADFDELLESYPDALKELFGIEEGSLTSGPGYLDAELFSLMLPLLVLVLAIGAGARAWAGEEEAGRLELVLAYPVRRRDALLAKAGALAAEVVVACGAAFVALAVMDAVVGLDLSLGRLAGAVGAVGLLGLLHGWLALAVGAAVPGRALAIGVPAALAAAAYLVGGLHELAGWLEPFRFGSSFWWIGSAPLRAGVSGWGVLVVAAAALAVLAAGAVLAERRDLRTA